MKSKRFKAGISRIKVPDMNNSDSDPISVEGGKLHIELDKQQKNGCILIVNKQF